MGMRWGHRDGGEENDGIRYAELSREAQTRVTGFGVLHSEPEAVASRAFNRPFHRVAVRVPSQREKLAVQVVFPAEFFRSAIRRELPLEPPVVTKRQLDVNLFLGI